MNITNCSLFTWYHDKTGKLANNGLSVAWATKGKYLGVYCLFLLPSQPNQIQHPSSLTCNK